MSGWRRWPEEFMGDGLAVVLQVESDKLEMKRTEINRMEKS